MPRYREAKIQSFHYDSNHRLNFAVSALDPLPAITKPSATAGVSTLLASQLRKLMGNSQTGRAMNSKAILPFFQHIGAADYIKGHDALALTELIALPQASDFLLMNLKKTVLHRCSEICKNVASSNPTVRRLLVATKMCVHCIYLQFHNLNIFRGTTGRSERFSAPISESARVSYALEEVRVLCLVLRCVQEGRYHTSSLSDTVQQTPGCFRLCLTLEQLAASKSLLDQLEDSSEKPVDAVNTLLNALYFPSNTLNMFEDQYTNPVNSYVCLRTVHPEGGFIKAEMATCHAVKTQFGIRLFILDFINRALVSYKKELVLSGPLCHPSLAAMPPPILKAKLRRKYHLVVESESDEAPGSAIESKMSALSLGTTDPHEDFTKYSIFFMMLAGGSTELCLQIF